MNPKPYKAKSLRSAELRVRKLERKVLEQGKLLAKLDYERLLLAKLAASTPQFYNPIAVVEAKTIRDRILASTNA